jgi:hypothetical protein
MRLLGMHVDRRARGPRAGWVEVGADHHQPWGLRHGGLFTAVIETFATAGAATACVGARGGLVAPGPGQRLVPAMTDPGPPAASAAAPPRQRRQRTLGFLAVCVLVFVLVAGWLYVFTPVSAPARVTLANLHGVGDL